MCSFIVLKKGIPYIWIPKFTSLEIQWQKIYFQNLSAAQLYAVLQLRNEVFVVEQQCIFQDADNHDQVSYHLLGWGQDALIAYARIIPPGQIYENASIGRVVCKQIYRGKNLGKLLMQEAIAYCVELFGQHTITIGAQLYLKEFYTSLGFQQCSDIYLEDGIEHIKMDYSFS